MSSDEAATIKSVTPTRESTAEPEGLVLSLLTLSELGCEFAARVANAYVPSGRARRRTDYVPWWKDAAVVDVLNEIRRRGEITAAERAEYLESVA